MIEVDPLGLDVGFKGLGFGGYAPMCDRLLVQGLRI